MNNNTGTDLSKFNDKYLKCIVTKRRSTMDILKDHGAIIVYQNGGINHLYLGDEFIAGGWGFKSKSDRDLATKIINNYDSDISELQESVDNLEEDVNNIKNKVDEISDKINPTVYITDENGERVKLDEVFFTGKPATYYDFELIDIEKVIIYNENQTLKLSGDINTIELPIGSIINKITYNINCNINDCGGIEEVDISFFESSDAYINNQATPVSVKSLQWVNLDSKKIVSITHEFVVPYRIDKGEDLKVINKLMIKLNETQKEQYKPYPDLKLTNSKFTIYSLENIIKAHNVFIDSLTVHPIHSLLYYVSRTSEQDMHDIKDNILENRASRYPYKGEVFIKDVESGEFKDVFIPIQTTDVKVINVFLPKSFEIHEVRYVTFNSEFNWTGATGVMTKNQNGSPITIRYNGLGSSALYRVYNFYQLRISESPISSTGKLMLRIFSRTNNYENDIFAGDAQGIYFDEPAQWDLLNNEEFNRTYWVSYVDSMDDLKDKLDLATSKF